MMLTYTLGCSVTPSGIENPFLEPTLTVFSVSSDVKFTVGVAPDSVMSAPAKDGMQLTKQMKSSKSISILPDVAVFTRKNVILNLYRFVFPNVMLLTTPSNCSLLLPSTSVIVMVCAVVAFVTSSINSTFTCVPM